VNILFGKLAPFPGTNPETTFVLLRSHPYNFAMVIGMIISLNKAQIPLGSSRLDTTRHVQNVEPVELVVSSTSSRACRTMLFDQLDTAKMHGLDTLLNNCMCRFCCVLVQKKTVLPYRYCSKNFSAYRCHPRSVVAYSAEVAHREVQIR